MKYDAKAILQKAASYTMIFKHFRWIGEIISSSRGRDHPLIRILPWVGSVQSDFEFPTLNIVQP